MHKLFPAEFDAHELADMLSKARADFEAKFETVDHASDLPPGLFEVLVTGGPIKDGQLYWFHIVSRGAFDPDIRETPRDAILSWAENARNIWPYPREVPAPMSMMFWKRRPELVGEVSASDSLNLLKRDGQVFTRWTVDALCYVIGPKRETLARGFDFQEG